MVLTSLHREHHLVHVALIMQRNPVMMRRLTPFEECYADYREAFQSEKSKGYLEFRTDADPDSSRSKGFGIVHQGGNRGGTMATASEGDVLRMPDRKLYLMVKTDDGWRFPKWKFEHDMDSKPLYEALLTYARQLCNGQCDLYFLGKSPLCLHTERYQDRVSPPFSSKQFFFKAQFLSGLLRPSSEHSWMSKDEIKATVPKGYWGAVKDILTN